MSSNARGGSNVAINNAIKEVDPGAIILVGVAFGMDAGKTPIGSVMISKQLGLYDLHKIALDKVSGEKIVIQRGDMPSASERLLGKFRACSGPPHWSGAAVHVGLILSGEKLINHTQFKQELLDDYPEAIGGEMEAAGAYVAAEYNKKDWIVVKGVCDFADGDKDRDKEKNQKTAAENAARLVHNMLTKIMSRPVRVFKGKKEKEGDDYPGSLDLDLQKLVREKIGELLAKQRMKEMRQALVQQFRGEGKPDFADDSVCLAEHLAGLPVLNAIRQVKMAVCTGIDTARDKNVAEAILGLAWNDCVGIVGWLVLASVDDEWAQNFAQRLARQGSILDLSLPVTTPAGPEIIFSRSKKTAARLRFNDTNRSVYGEKEIDCDSWKIESGWQTIDKALTFKQLLWKYLIKSDPPEMKAFTDIKNRELNQTLIERQKKGEHHYIALHRDCRNQSWVF